MKIPAVFGSGLAFLFLLYAPLSRADNPREAVTPILPSPTHVPIIIAGDDSPTASTSLAEPAAGQVGPALPPAHPPSPKRLVLEKGSRLWVKGFTTQRSFELWADQLLGSAVLQAPVNASRGRTALLEVVQKEGLEAMSLRVPIVGLQASDIQVEHGSDYALAGPYQALKGAQSPDVRFLLEKETLGKPSSPGVYAIQAKGKLTIAGVAQGVSLRAQAAFTGNQVRVTGSYRVRLNEFNIKPLADVWGAMSADNSVEVYFDLLFGPEEEVPETPSATGTPYAAGTP